MQKLIRKRHRFEGVTMGLDLHKQFTQFSLLDGSGDELANDRVGVNREALEALVDRAEQAANGSPVQVVIEACRCYRWVWDTLCSRLGREHVHVAVAQKVKAIAESGEKTDANDAWWLAYLAWDGRLPTAKVVSGELYEIRTACRERQAVVHMRTMSILRAVSHLAQQGLYLNKGEFATREGRVRVDRFVSGLAGGMVREAIERVLVTIEGLDEEIAHWDGRLKELCKSQEMISTVEAVIPGLGRLTAASVVSEIGDPRDYSSAKAYAKATGVTPGYRSSGGRTRSMTITRSGSARARWSLTRAIVICMNPKNEVGRAIRVWVARRLRRKPKQVVIVAAARKLAEAIWRLFHYGEAFDLDTAFAT